MTSMSVLDQSPIDINETVNDGIQRTVELAQLADKLKYTRYFVAEHHNIPEVGYKPRNISDIYSTRLTKYVLAQEESCYSTIVLLK